MAEVFSWISPSTLRVASLTAATMRSWSMATSSLLTTSGSMVTERSAFRPSISTLTMPPPAVASTEMAAISCCRRSCICWNCFISLRGSPNGFTPPPLWLGFAHVHDARAEQVQRLLHRGLPRRLLHQVLPACLHHRRRLVSLGRGRARSDAHLRRTTSGLGRHPRVLVDVHLREGDKVGGHL